MNKDRRFFVEIQEDVASGDLIVSIPPAILNENCWYEGAELEWALEGDEVILRESTND